MPDSISTNVSNVPISKSYKGILRISHILEKKSDEEDVFSNPYYYGDPSDKLDISGSPNGNQKPIAFQSATRFLEGNGIRYSFTDTFESSKIPITDSLGNFLNIKIGYDGTTIGSDYGINGNEISKSAPTILDVSKKIYIGAAHNDGGINHDGSIIIESVKDNDGMIIVDTPEVFNDNNTRTIYKLKNNSIKQYDSITYNQENYNRNNLNFATIDNELSITNLYDYISDKISIYKENNINEVLSGTIIWQYSNFDFYRNVSIEQAGHRPRLNYNVDSKSNLLYFSASNNNLIQNLQNPISSPLPRLVNNQLRDPQCSEIKPLYKRDYVLCDGGVYNIILNPLINDSFKYLFNIFFGIRYYYTDFKNSSIRHKYYKLKVDDETKMKIIDIENVDDAYTYSSSLEHFDIDMACIIIWQMIIIDIKNFKTHGDSLCRNQLDYFNEQIVYENLKNGKFFSRYGKLFEELVWNDSMNNAVESPNHIIHRNGEKYALYDLPEIRFLLKTFELQYVTGDISTATRHFNNYFQFYFQVPNLCSNGKIYSSGLMIGSCNHFINANFENFNDPQTTFEWKNDLNTKNFDHRHVIFKGKDAFSLYDYPQSSISAGEIDNNSFPLSDHRFNWNKDDIQNTSALNYAFSEINNSDGLSFVEEKSPYRNNYSRIVLKSNKTDTSGIQNDLRFLNNEPNRGITGPPVYLIDTLPDKTNNPKYKWNTKRLIAEYEYGTSNFFTPENVSMLPLLKL